MPKQLIKKTHNKQSGSAAVTIRSRKSHLENSFFLAIPWLFLLTLIALFVSLYYSFWPGEILVSFLPQIFIILAGLGLVYATLATWGVMKFGLYGYLDNISTLNRVVMVLTILIGSAMLYISTNLINSTNFVQSYRVDFNGITVGTFNKLYNSEDFINDTEFLYAKNTDIISLQEINTEEINILKDILGYEYSAITECNCSAYNTEVGIVSKYPIRNAIAIYESENALILRSLIDSDIHGEFVIYTVHLHVPNSAKNLANRADAYNLLTNELQKEELPVFVMGDFNTTVFSPQFQRFSAQNESTISPVYARTWPHCSWYGFTSVGCLRIDHVFVPSSAQVRALHIGEKSSSDHRPVIVELAI